MSVNIAQTVKEIIAKRFGIDAATISDDARFIDDLGADSLDTVELVMTLEEEFDVEITNEEGQEIQVVKDAISFIEKKLN